MESSVIFSAIIGLIYLISFFIMASNVAAIKKLLSSTAPDKEFQALRKNYYKYMTLGDKRKAYESLLDIVFYQLTDPRLDKPQRNKMYAELKEKYQKFYDLVEQPFPENPFN